MLMLLASEVKHISCRIYADFNFFDFKFKRVFMLYCQFYAKYVPFTGPIFKRKCTKYADFMHYHHLRLETQA